MYSEMFFKSFLKEEKSKFTRFVKNLTQILNSEFYQNCIIFLWEDGTGDNLKYDLDNLFGKEIIGHKLCEIIR